jgi:hypothetical protein
LGRGCAQIIAAYLVFAFIPSGVGRNATTSVVSDFDLQAQFATLRTELLQLVADRIEEVSRPLRDEAAAMKLG